MTNHITSTNKFQAKNSTRKNSSPAFTLKNVRQVKEDQVILDNINLEIESGKITALIGPSGAGKTSLLRMLNRLDDTESGEIFYHSKSINEYSVQNLRLQVSFVFQTPVMFPGTVADNLQTALELAGKPIIDSDKLINENLRLAEIDETLIERDSSQLSVGQKQRVSIARALMSEPKVLLLDEPTSALDPETADNLMETVRRLVIEKNITVIMVTHRLSEARRISDMTIVMESGKIAEFDKTENVFGQTKTPGIRKFLRSEK